MRRATGRRAGIGVTALLVSTSALAAAGNASVGARRSSLVMRPRTLLSTRHVIRAFAQDGGRIAWIAWSRQRGRRVGCALHVRAVRGGRTAVTPLDDASCPRNSLWTGAIALAGGTAVWADHVTGGNTERSWDVERAVAGDRAPSLVGTANFFCPGDCADVQPLFAGSGRLLAYSYDPLGRVTRVVAGGTHRLFATRGDLEGLAVEGGGLTAAVSQVFAPGDGCGCLDDPAWSPDGSKIAYLGGTVDLESSNGWTLGVMNADGSDRRELTASSGLGAVSVAESPSWSPDGSKIAYGDPAGNIDVVNADGSGSQTLGRGDGPAWSPDGKSIAFSNNGVLEEMNADGSNAHQLGNDISGSEPAWSPDGTEIAFGSGGDIWTMNADGSNAHQLGTGIAGDQPAWSPDGSQIVFSSTNPDDATVPNGGLWTVGADGSGLHRLTEGPDERPSWSPDGKTIAFASLRDDAYANNGIFDPVQSFELYLVAPDGSSLRPLSFTKPAELESETIAGSARKHTTFAAPGVPRGVALAGKLAAVGSVSSGTDRVTLFDAQTGAQLASLQAGENPKYFRLVGADSHWLVYEGHRTISAMNTGTHEVIHLADLAEDTIDVSVSGRRVAWAEDYPGRKPDRGHALIRTVQLPS
jgi:hypothetical protein